METLDMVRSNQAHFELDFELAPPLWFNLICHENLICIYTNGIQIKVEIEGPLSSYIDVLACSSKNTTETLRIFHQLIIPAIQSVSSSIIFTEKIIRPDCVKHLIPPRLRKSQCVPVQQIKQALLSMPADSLYDYQHTWSSLMHNNKLILQPGSNYARDLLSDEDFKEVLHRRYYDLHQLATELSVPIDNPQESPKVDVNDPQHSIEPSLVNFNIQLEERKVPRLFYFVQVQNNTRRLITALIPGMTSLRLHMMCEYRGEIHVVDDQVGCELMQVDNQAIKSLLPYMAGLMKLLTFALKIGAHVAAGMGQMIPDLAREVARLIDSSLVYGAAAMAAGAAGYAAAGQGGRRYRSRGGGRNLAQEVVGAEQWLVEFLRAQKVTRGKDISERFGLWRVRYRDSGHVAWICRNHMILRRNEFVEVPL